MNYSLVCRSLLPILCFLSIGSQPSTAAPNPQVSAERPYVTLFGASIDKLLDACRSVFREVDRPDLAQTLGDRLKGYQDFSGIDQSKPFGLMSTWDDEAPINIVFLPVSKIDDLLKTATFGIVDFHQVNPDQYEIERPGLPYHVLVIKNYAYFADSLTSIRSLSVAPEQLTQGLRDRYDAVVNFDLMQIPRPTKDKFVVDIRGQVEPWLQPQDDEVSESANLRKSVGKMLLGLFERAVLDTKSVTIGCRLDPDSKHLIIEVAVEAISKSSLAAGLNRLGSFRSEFASLLQPDIPAGMAINLPVGDLIGQILGPTDDSKTEGAPLEAGLQLAGTGIGDFTIIGALHGADADRINDSIPDLILKMEESGKFITVHENIDRHRGVAMHSLTPRDMPGEVKNWIGPEIEIVVGQGKQTVWVGIGQPSTLIDRVMDAIDLVEEAPTARETGHLLRARFQARKLPEIVASGPLIPNADAKSTRDELSLGEDGFSVTLDHVRDGLRLKIEAEAGFIRLVGRDWVKQIEGQAPPENEINPK